MSDLNEFRKLAGLAPSRPSLTEVTAQGEEGAWTQQMMRALTDKMPPTLLLRILVQAVERNDAAIIEQCNVVMVRQQLPSSKPEFKHLSELIFTYLRVLRSNHPEHADAARDRIGKTAAVMLTRQKKTNVAQEVQRINKILQQAAQDMLTLADDVPDTAGWQQQIKKLDQVQWALIDVWNEIK